MRRLWLLALVVFLLGCDDSGAPQTPETPQPSETSSAAATAAPVAPEAHFAESTNDFGLALHRLLSQRGHNVVTSPANVAVILRMLAHGARGETERELWTVLGTDGTDARPPRWNDAGKPYALLQAQRLFVDDDVRLVPAYVRLVEGAFGAGIERTDFLAAPERSRLHINQWAREQTKNRVRDLLPPGSIDENTALVAASAVYLRANWEFGFGKESTRPGWFTTEDGRRVEVPMMSQQIHRARAAEVAGVKAVELCYQGCDLAMLFLLPSSSELAALESRLTHADLVAIVDALAPVKTLVVTLPRFTISSARPIDLIPPLKHMGVQLAFDGTQADFSGMVELRGVQRVFVGSAFHKATIAVDEEGTEATAAAAAAAQLYGGLFKQLTADRPFLFLLRDTRSGTVLFLGRVADPSQR